MRFTASGSLFLVSCLVGACSVPLPPPEYGGAAAYDSSIGLSDPILAPAAAQPKGTLMAQMSFGRFQHETFSSTGPTLNDTTDAQKYKLQFEGVRNDTGGGVQLEFTTVDNDLHSSLGGVTSTDTGDLELFGHFTARPHGGEIFRVPIRVGPYLDVLTQKASGTGTTDLSYFTFGVRVEVEPEFDVLRRDDKVLSVFAGARGGVGLSIVGFESGTIDESFSTTESHVGFHGGARFRIAKFNIEAGFAQQRRNFAESDPELAGGSLIVINKAEFTFTGFFISAGVRW